ncbi:conserved hypothetical protein [Bosea sp. 127]|nr:conserved hypothetical protein [Bosea sp. 127]
MAEWALRPKSLASLADGEEAMLDTDEARKIKMFSMSDLDDDASINPAAA